MNALDDEERQAFARIAVTAFTRFVNLSVRNKEGPAATASGPLLSFTMRLRQGRVGSVGLGHFFVGI
jgi:hypothetical protein